MSLQQDPTTVPEDTVKVEVNVDIVKDLTRSLTIAVKHIAALEKKSVCEAKKVAIQTIRDLNSQLFTLQREITLLKSENETVDDSLTEIQTYIGVFETKEEAEADLLAANDKLAALEAETNAAAIAEHEQLTARLRMLENAYTICTSKSSLA